jgi:aconitate hydratase
MDARSIAVSAASGACIASAAAWAGIEEAENAAAEISCHYDDKPYKARVYRGFGAPDAEKTLVLGPNIAGWPEMPDLGENLLLRIASFITDPVTTTDELIPSGETSSYRSNPLGLAEFTLSRKDPGYTGRAKKIAEAETARKKIAEDGNSASVIFPEIDGLPEMSALFAEIKKISGSGVFPLRDLRIGSAIYARKPGDGSAREQAASCQKVLGGWANFAGEYATKRYRSNLINWGIVPFVLKEAPEFALGDFVFIPGLRTAIEKDSKTAAAYIFCCPGSGGSNFAVRQFSLDMPPLNGAEKAALLAGSLINLNRRERKQQAAKK